MNNRKKINYLAMTIASLTAFSGNIHALSLEEATTLAIKNSPKILTEGLTVKGKGAEKDVAYKTFDPKLEAEYTVNKLGGFEYPDELERLSLASLTGASPNTSFLPDNSRTHDLKLALKKVFLTGIYTEFGVNVTQKITDRDKLSLSPAIKALNNGGLRRSVDDYFPLDYGLIKFVTRFPLWGRGDLAEAIGDYKSKQLKHQAAVANMNYAISSIIASAVYAYWDNRAAVALYELRKTSFERVQKWQKHILQIMDNTPNPAATRASYAADLGRIDGFVKEKNKDFNAAQTVLNDTRAALANALGIPLVKAKEIGDATDPIPILSNTNGVDAQVWHEIALNKRFDIQALKLEEQAANEFLSWMNDYSDPELNLVLALHQQMSDFGDDGVSGYYNTVKNPSGDLGYTVGLQFSMKIGNSAGKGRITQATLGKMQIKINLDNKLRQINVDIKGYADRLISTIATVNSATQSANAYAQSAEAARADKRQTMETAYKQFDTERYWVNAEADRIAAEALLAKAIIETRHQTGTLINPTETDSQIKLQDMVSLPSK